MRLGSFSSSVNNTRAALRSLLSANCTRHNSRLLRKPNSPTILSSASRRSFSNGRLGFLKVLPSVQSRHKDRVSQGFRHHARAHVRAHRANPARVHQNRVQPLACDASNAPPRAHRASRRAAPRRSDRATVARNPKTARSRASPAPFTRARVRRIAPRRIASHRTSSRTVTVERRRRHGGRAPLRVVKRRMRMARRAGSRTSVVRERGRSDTTGSHRSTRDARSISISMHA